MIFWIKYTILPRLRVRLRFYWWVIKYRGKKNIPPEVIFNSIRRSSQRMIDNLEKASNVEGNYLNHEQTLEFGDMMSKVKELDECLDEVEGNSSMS